MVVFLSSYVGNHQICHTMLAPKVQRLLTQSHRQIMKQICKTFSSSSTTQKFKTVNLRSGTELQRWNEENEYLFGGRLSSSNSTAVDKDTASSASKHGQNLADSQKNVQRKAAHDTQRKMPMETRSESGDSEADNPVPDVDTSGFDSIFLFPLFRPTRPQMLSFQPVVSIELPYNLGVQPPPGVTSILKKTMSPENRFFLERWEKQMISELGWEGFQILKKGITIKLIHHVNHDLGAGDTVFRRLCLPLMEHNV